MGNFFRQIFFVLALIFGSLQVYAADTDLSEEYPFNVEIATPADNTMFYISIAATGNFAIDWGDDGDDDNPRVISVTPTDTEPVIYSHKYAAAKSYTVKIGGMATGYNTDSYTSTITFHTSVTNTNVARRYNSNLLMAVYGRLGAVFPTLMVSTTTQKVPKFYQTFSYASNLTSIPDTLFKGATGSTNHMFCHTFEGCINLMEIPAGLFSDVNGGAGSMFSYTFYGCKSLTQIPPDLFVGVNRSAAHLFANAFEQCSGLTDIPPGLFGSIRGNGQYMFKSTFAYCGGLREIPTGLFSGINGASQYMFRRTFYGCINLNVIPFDLFSGVTGNENGVFDSTFYGCNDLQYIRIGDELINYIPHGMFPDNTENRVVMYADTFDTDSKLASVCPVNMYRQNVVNGWGNTPAVCWSCPDGLVAPSGSVGAEACTACIDGYGPNFETGLCQIKCGGGTYVAHAGGGCVDVETGYWAPISSVTYGAVGVRNACPAGLHTTGRGIGADELGDCGRVLHFGAHTLHLRSQKRTTPSLNVQIGDHRLYGDMTTEQRGHLRLRVGDMVYSVHNPDVADSGNNDTDY